jgi:hypothetical protein
MQRMGDGTQTLRLGVEIGTDYRVLPSMIFSPTLQTMIPHQTAIHILPIYMNLIGRRCAIGACHHIRYLCFIISYNILPY